MKFLNNMQNEKSKCCGYEKVIRKPECGGCGKPFIPSKCTCQYEDKHGLTCPLYVPSKNPMEECKQCEIEGNTGICDRKDCKNYSNQEDKDWAKKFDKQFDGYWRGQTIPDEIKFFIKKTKQESYEEGVKTFDKELRERIEYLTHYCRSKFSQDCSRNETDEEKSTEMVSKEDLIKTLSTIINSLKND
jgi:hypothetical protein